MLTVNNSIDMLFIYNMLIVNNSIDMLFIYNMLIVNNSIDMLFIYNMLIVNNSIDMLFIYNMLIVNNSIDMLFIYNMLIFNNSFVMLTCFQFLIRTFLVQLYLLFKFDRAVILQWLTSFHLQDRLPMCYQPEINKQHNNMHSPVHVILLVCIWTIIMSNVSLHTYSIFNRSSVCAHCKRTYACVYN